MSIQNEIRPVAFSNPNEALAFIFGGDATVTFKSLKAQDAGGQQTRYTYQIQEGKQSESDRVTGRKAPFFVKILVGQDNEEDFAYMGMITFYQGRPSFRLTAASLRANLTEDDKRVKAFRWTFAPLTEGKLPYGVNIYPSIRCARCGRKLTNSDQPGYAQGFGPDCFEMMGGSAYITKFAAEIRTAVAPMTNAIKVSSEQIGDTTGMVTMFKDGKLTEAGRMNGNLDAMRAAATAGDGRQVLSTVKPKPTTPKAIVAAVNEDVEIAKLADELWAKNPVNPVNIAPKVAPEPLPVDEAVAVALAKSQIGWTVDDAKKALAKRKIVNLNLKPSTLVADKVETLIGTEQGTFVHWVPGVGANKATEEKVPAIPMPEHSVPETRQEDPAIIAKVNTLKADRETFTSDGIMDEDEAFSFWYRRFAANNTPVEG